MDILNNDLKDFIIELNRCNVDYLLVGGYAVVLRGYSRSTGDMDIWVRRTAENHEKLMKAFALFGLPTALLNKEKFLSADLDVFSFGRPPVAIDVMTEMKGVSFDEAFANAEWVERFDIKIHLIHLNDLIATKKAAGRNKDLNDIENLPTPEEQ